MLCTQLVDVLAAKTCYFLDSFALSLLYMVSKHSHKKVELSEY